MLLTRGDRLTAAEAEALWREWTIERDAGARDRLVLAYAPMVRYVASRKVLELPAHCELDDLVSSGLVALVEAVDRFDPRKGATFEQYAWTRVAGAVIDELRRQESLSRSLRRFRRELKAARERLAATSGRAPSERELAGGLGLEVGEYRERLEQLHRADLVSLNAPSDARDDVGATIELGDTIEAPHGRHEPELALLADARSSALRSAIAELSERERAILAYVHVEHLQGAEIGRRLGVSESRVSQILSSVRAKLRTSLDEYEAA